MEAEEKPTTSPRSKGFTVAGEDSPAGRGAVHSERENSGCVAGEAEPSHTLSVRQTSLDLVQEAVGNH